jgi:hypothetical protein
VATVLAVAVSGDSAAVVVADGAVVADSAEAGEDDRHGAPGNQDQQDLPGLTAGNDFTKQLNNDQTVL